jgi:hypothetical protein
MNAIKWVSTNRVLVAAYLVGLSLCTASFVVPYYDLTIPYYGRTPPFEINGLNLAESVVAGELGDLVHVYTEGIAATLLMAASMAMLATLFPLAAWLVRYNREGVYSSKGVRVIGVLLSVVLLLMTLWWFPLEL